MPSCAVTKKGHRSRLKGLSPPAGSGTKAMEVGCRVGRRCSLSKQARRTSAMVKRSPRPMPNKRVNRPESKSGISHTARKTLTPRSAHEPVALTALIGSKSSKHTSPQRDTKSRTKGYVNTASRCGKPKSRHECRSKVAEANSGRPSYQTKYKCEPLLLVCMPRTF